MQFRPLLILWLFSITPFCLSGQVIDTTQLIFSKKIYFDFGKYELTDSALTTLQKLKGSLEKEKHFLVKITAHTDAIGSNENNIKLSQNRAAAIQQHLTNIGIPPSSIAVSTFGETRPASDNETASGRQLNRRATIDIFKKLKFFALKGQVKDQETNQAIEADITVRTKDTSDSLRTDSMGNFEVLLPLGAVAGIDVFTKNYFFETRMFKVDPSLTEGFSIKLKKAEVGEKIDLKNLYFVGNQAVLLQRSKPELPKLLKFMQLNGAIKIEIAGHINRPNHPPVNEFSWDYKLSVRRAKMVYDYLKNHNISPERIHYMGYGNSQMRYPNARTAQEQALNRRVEIVILEKG